MSADTLIDVGAVLFCIVASGCGLAALPWSMTDLIGVQQAHRSTFQWLSESLLADHKQRSSLVPPSVVRADLRSRPSVRSTSRRVAA